jgi:hypothetical protein
MRPSQIEAWALRIVDAIEKHAPTEDSRVELKAAWPDPKKAARQIAGPANAAHGEPILWLVGVDERTGVIGADREELSQWWPQVESHFDGIAPRLSDLNIPVNDVMIVGLLFETDRAPFVVNNPTANMDKEVPWREGTRVRSARRADLIRLLEPIDKLPEVDVLWGHCESFFITGCLFISPPRDQTLVIPVHQCVGSVCGADGERAAALTKLCFLEQRKSSARFDLKETEIVISAPRQVGVQAEFDSDVAERLRGKDVILTIDLRPAGFQLAATIKETLPWVENEQCWKLNRIEWVDFHVLF